MMIMMIMIMMMIMIIMMMMVMMMNGRWGASQCQWGGGATLPDFRWELTLSLGYHKLDNLDGEAKHPQYYH